MIYRIYTEKKAPFAQDAAALLTELRDVLGIKTLTGLRLVHRFDVEGIDAEVFNACMDTVFCEPPVENRFNEPPTDAAAQFLSEYLPGQFDQRADSCAQCIQVVSGGARPVVRTARLYLLYGAPTSADVAAIKKYLINPVESRETSPDLPKTLIEKSPVPASIPVIDGFLDLDEAGLHAALKTLGLGMDINDLTFCQKYFREEKRNPTLAELRVIDTYWSDHCRHSTFLTNLTEIEFEDAKSAAAYERYRNLRRELGIQKPVTMMDMATIGMKYLREKDKLDALDSSKEVNACTVRIDVDANGKTEPWILLFKNETHNHPTEIEPFGGAATCIGGGIRDPLSGRGYAYQGMRVTASADPTVPFDATLPGKLPQRKITTTAAAGYSSYANQIGLPGGLVWEIYHPGYVAKRMEAGAVVAAAPAGCVRREEPVPGDVVLLLGCKTGRDGCGGATGSSKAQDSSAMDTLGAEVQKGNAPEEHKIQRLFRKPEAARLIKRCNDFGAGGVSVAIGELADGLLINLDTVPAKYDGLDGTELAISESQERMAIVLSASDVSAFKALAAEEDLEATTVAEVSANPRLTMHWRGETIIDMSREFMDSSGAERYSKASVKAGKAFSSASTGSNLDEKMRALVSDLNVCSQRGIAERFDSTVGAGTVLSPLGGSRGRTPIQAMAAKLPVTGGDTTTCSLMACGYNPYLSSLDPYAGAYLAVVESVAKVIAVGGDTGRCWLSFQEFFPSLKQDSERWGMPVAALLGALSAQLDLGLAAIGGKDSMSGSFENIDVPPALISFATSVTETGRIVSPEFKKLGSRVVLLAPEYDNNGLPKTESLQKTFETAAKLLASGDVLAAYTPTYGGIAEGIFKMCLGNGLGFELDGSIDDALLFGLNYGSFILELSDKAADTGRVLGRTIPEYELRHNSGKISINELEKAYESRLESVFPVNAPAPSEKIETFSYTTASHAAPKIKTASPNVLIPVFIGANGEYDMAAAFEKAGAKPKVIVVKNSSPALIKESVQQLAKEIKEAQIIALPGGSVCGDEPNGAGKFIANFLRDPALAEALSDLLENRDGLMCGIGNGFQALLKLGLLPYGSIRDIDESCPALTSNVIGRHQSKFVQIRIASALSPWLSLCKVGDIHTVAASHGSGRFVCPADLLKELAAKGQIVSQYVDANGIPSMDTQYNPSGSFMAIEAITSPDGRIFGQMCHPERVSAGTLLNVPGNKDYPVFAGAVRYFK